MQYQVSRNLTIVDPRYAVQSTPPSNGQQGQMILSFPLPTIPEATTLAIVLNRNTAEEMLAFIRMAVDNMKGLKPGETMCFKCGKPAVKTIGIHDDCAVELKR